jgi:hypothetical protein
MTIKQNWIGADGFTWFLGIVQDINDPLNCGRVKIRCVGWHSDNVNELPVENLPWAQVLMPVTSASTSSVGRSGTGLLNGSYVMGFFLDGETSQQPIVMGSLHGIPDGSDQGGYSDPDGIYPKFPGFPDTPNLAYDRFIQDSITKDKEANVVKDVPTARLQKVTSVSSDVGEEDYELKTWSEPLPRNGKDPVYPKNHVTQTESGHAIEIDDTVENERIHIYHRTGTFCEIQDTGDRVTKIIGDDYEICVQDKNVLISGKCNITVTGDARLYVEGNMIQEVGGNYNLTVHGDMKTKINGNDVKEILGSRSHQINGDEARRISGKRDIIVGGTLSESIAGATSLTYGTKPLGGGLTQIIVGNLNSTTSGNVNQVSGKQMDIGSGQAMNIAAGSKMNIKSIDNYQVDAPRIDLN